MRRRADPPGVTPSAVLDAALARMEGLWLSLMTEIPGSAGMLMDRDLRVRTAIGPLWGRTPSELATMRGKTLADMVPAPIAAGIARHFEAALTGQTRRFDIVTHITYRCSIAPVLDDQGRIAGAVALAFSEEQALHDERAGAAELARRLSQQSAVARLGELALRRPDLDVLLDAACVAVTEGLGVDASFVLEPAGPNGLMRIRAGRGWSDGFVGSEFEMSSFADERRDLYAKPVVIADLPNDTQWRARPLRDQGVVSAATVRVGPADSVAGMLGAYTFSPRRFGDRDLDFLSAVAHVLNGAVASLEVERRIRHDALHDALTGLPNRTLLLEHLTAAVERADGEGRQLALYFLDVDHLKVLNDSLGHHAGDELLRAIGPRVRSVLREGDMIARFGGDEFAVLCDDIADEAQGLRVAERLVRAFARPFEVCGEPRFCSISVGVVVSDPHGDRGPEELLSDADAALYRAKERGRGRHEVFDAGMRDRMTVRLRTEDDLRRALEAGDQLWIAYQPIVRLPDLAVVSVEALLRWTHPERGAVPPSEFIPVAEDSGLIVELGELVLRTACAQVARWGGGLRLTVNVSARQMALSGMPGTVGAVLRETGLPADRLGLEITEGLLLEETPATMETLDSLRRLGVRLMLDDFGTGYSSLSYLRRYPLDALKIDQAFVHDLGEDGRGDAAIVQAIIGMARALGLVVVPEGVETEGQLVRLIELGCQYAQGFHLGRPLPAAERRS